MAIYYYGMQKVDKAEATIGPEKDKAYYGCRYCTALHRNCTAIGSEPVAE